MNRTAYLIVMIITALIAAAAMLFIDRAITGYMQCPSTNSCHSHGGRL